jgi:uncharacterized membrane protein SpoIIM required for sporulation
MNVERWVASRQVYWQKLETLLKRVDKRGLSSLAREELQSLGRLYRSAASDLSRARAMELGADITGYLNNLVVKGHNQVYQSPRNRWRDLWRFLWTTFPLNFRKNFAYVFVSFLVFFIPMTGTWLMILSDPKTAHFETMSGHALVSDELYSYVEKKRLWTDSVAGESPAASSFIATNNIRVSLLAFVLGTTFGLGTVWVLLTNGMSIGSAFAVCQLHGMAHRLAAFVAPHGVFELSAIFISGGAGLMLARGMLFPGQYMRSDALKLMAREGAILFLGCIPLLLIAGSIEGFVSPRTDIRQEFKYAVSLATFALLLLYLFLPRESESNSQKELLSSGGDACSSPADAAGSSPDDAPAKKPSNSQS